MLSATYVLTVTLTIATAARTPPPPLVPDRPFTDIAQNLGHDVRTLPSPRTAAILAVGTVAALALHPVDDDVASWAASQGKASYTALGRFAGDGWVQAGVAVGTYTVGLVSKDAEITHIGSDFIRGQLLTGIITRVVKVSADRTRPSGGTHSMPSGHTSAAFLTASVLEGHYGWRAGIPAYATAGFIGWTRVRDNSHWLTDVVTGATIGLAVGHTVTASHRSMKWVVTPAATPGGAAIYVMRQ